jgi:pyruvate-formate lyase-activating enzyme
MVSRVVLDLVQRVGAVASGATVEVPIADADADTVAAWCQRTGNELVRLDRGRAVVRRGRPTAAGPSGVDLTRLWLYTNFDCNLACDYCCARSSPRAERRALGPDRVRRLVAEAADAGLREVFLTGGEPFLLPDLDLVVAACVRRLPTTLLTNGMLFRATRLDMLRRMPRDGFTLQISLDSADAGPHDGHRGRGTWRRARDGITIALAEGFRVRVAATVPPAEDDRGARASFHELLDAIGIPREDQIIRPVAARGFATEGVAVTVETLVPEIAVTANGVYWHPVGADHEDQLVTSDLFPLGAAIDEVRRRFVEYRRTVDAGADHFPCA